MVGIAHGIFRVVLLTPKAKLVDCRAGSLILPSHDGQRGILRNHCPMLAKLSLGIVEVRGIPNLPDLFFIVDGGFVRVTENHVTILAYDVTTFDGKDKEEIQKMVSDAQSVIVGQEYIRTQRRDVDVQRARLLVRMARLAGVEIA